MKAVEAMEEAEAETVVEAMEVVVLLVARVAKVTQVVPNLRTCRFRSERARKAAAPPSRVCTAMEPPTSRWR